MEYVGISKVKESQLSTFGGLQQGQTRDVNLEKGVRVACVCIRISKYIRGDISSTSS
jgi:hypothetical protein